MIYTYILASTPEGLKAGKAISDSVARPLQPHYSCDFLIMQIEDTSQFTVFGLQGRWQEKFRKVCGRTRMPPDYLLAEFLRAEGVGCEVSYAADQPDPKDIN